MYIVIASSINFVFCILLQFQASRLKRLNAILVQVPNEHNVPKMHQKVPKEQLQPKLTYLYETLKLIIWHRIDI